MIRMIIVVLLFLVAWAFCSFRFWKHLRDRAVAEETIFSIMFWASITSLSVSRLAYVFLHWNQFAGQVLRIFTPWLSPGLSFAGFFLGLTITLAILSHTYGVRRSYTIDAIAKAFGWSFIIGSIAVYISGGVVGKVASLPWAITFPGVSGKRHPVEVYEALGIVMMYLILFLFAKRKNSALGNNGFFGLWFFFLWSLTMFCLEFFKESSVYWGRLTVHQWVLIGIFAETVGILFVWGGGRIVIRRIYAIISKRITARFAKTS